jgi:molybdopterin-containing oxidoreductase family iron-sulfur binding subunit
MSTGRREFLRYSLTVLGAAAAGAGVYGIVSRCGGSSAENAQGNAGLSHNEKNLAARRGVAGRKWVMVIDLAKCDGCGKCQSACSSMHFVPPDRQWIKVNRMQDAPDTAPYFFPQPCYHCDNPPCTKVCPVDATFKRQDGIVLVDNERCIGCRFCMAACPYNARSFNWGHPTDPPQAMAKEYTPEDGYPRRIGTVEKCDFCPDMAAMGMLPGCAAGCPMNAIYYGDQNEDAVTNSAGETQRLSKMLLDHGGYRFMEELGTQPRVYYLPPANRKYAPPYWDKKHPIASDFTSPPLCAVEPGQRPGLTEDAAGGRIA